MSAEMAFWTRLVWSKECAEPPGQPLRSEDNTQNRAPLDPESTEMRRRFPAQRTVGLMAASEHFRLSSRGRDRLISDEPDKGHRTCPPGIVSTARDQRGPADYKHWF